MTDSIKDVNKKVKTPNAPVVKLVGEDGNAFSILGRCHKAARKAGWTNEQFDAVFEEVKQGDYIHLLFTIMKYFNVE